VVYNEIGSDNFPETIGKGFSLVVEFHQLQGRILE